MSDGWPVETLVESEGTGVLVELLDRLTLKIEKNQEIINRIVVDVDSDFDLPEIPNNKLNESLVNRSEDIAIGEDKRVPEFGSESDILKKLLQEKYKLDQINIPDPILEEDPKIRELIINNRRLEIIHQRNIKINKEYFSIIQNCESLTINGILPALRSDTYNYIYNSLFRDFKENVLNEKYETDYKIWDRYINYLNKLQTIIALSTNLISILEKQSKDEEAKLIYLKLVIIEELKKYLSAKISVVI